MEDRSREELVRQIDLLQKRISELEIIDNKRRAAEETLRDSEEKYRILYKSSRDAIMIIDPPDWRFTSGNPATVEMFRAKDEAEFTSKAPWQLSPEYQPDGEPSSTKAKRMIDTAMERGSNFFEWTHRRLDGEDFSATVLLTRVEIKGRTFVQATVRDVTERKAAEEKITGLHKQIEFILGATKTGLDIIDEDFNVIFVDSEWKKIYGEYAGRKCYEYFMGRDLACPVCGISTALATKRLFVTEETLVRENNRPVQVTTIPFQDEKGRWLVAEVNVDITERKRAENDLARAQEELNQSKRLSEIGMLAATIAHELRNPMGVIRTANYNIKRKTQNKTIDKHIDMIEKKIMEADQIISNLLFYASVKMPHYEKVEIYGMLRESVMEAKDRFSDKPAQVSEKYEKLKTVIIEADPVQLREVFGNMLNNAYEAAPDNNGKIAISAGVDAKNQEIDISFKDNGQGIDPDNMKRIKTPFFTTKAKGMGLGLSVCYQIIGLHGGSILVESVKGKGAKFTVSIPIKRAGTKAGAK
jgi:PAS domain S-box-containing protein